MKVLSAGRSLSISVDRWHDESVEYPLNLSLFFKAIGWLRQRNSLFHL
jgi:hypothetical protein